MSIKSACLLSLASLLLLTGLACLVIGFATDFWLKYNVNYPQIFRDIGRAPPTGPEALNRTKLLVDRTRGLFHWCYPDYKPTDVGLVRKYVDDFCERISYRLFDAMNASQKKRIHLMRTQIGFYVVAFLFYLLALVVGIVGCWKRSPLKILATALLILIATAFAAAATGIFHAIKNIESNVLRDVPESMTTFDVPDVVRNNTHVRFWWSYMLAWIGIGLTLLAGLLFLLTACCLNRDRNRSGRRYMQNYASNKVLVGGGAATGAAAMAGAHSAHAGGGDRYFIPVYYDNPGNIPVAGSQGLPPGASSTVYYDNGYYRSPPPPAGTNSTVTRTTYYPATGVGGDTNTAGYGYGYYK